MATENNSLIMTREYFITFGGLGIAYLDDDGLAYYLDKESGQWVEDSFTWRHITGIGGDADAREITEAEARQWIKENPPHLDPIDLTNATLIDCFL
jgi:hypothetical protein